MSLAVPTFPPLTGRAGVLAGRLMELAIILQPLVGGLVYLSILAGSPPLWLSWGLFLLPFYFRRLRGEPVIRATPFDIPIIIFLAGLVLGVAVSPDKTASLDAFQTYLASIILYYTGVTNGLGRKWYWTFTVCLWLVLAAALVTVTFLQAGTGARVLPFNQWLYGLGSLLPADGDQRQYAFSVNIMGTALGTLAPFSLALAAFLKRARARLAAGLVAILSGLLLLLSGSTSGGIAALAGLALLLVLWKPWALAVLAAGLAGGLWWLISVWHPSSSLAPLLPLGTLFGRLDVWQRTVEMLGQSPLLGIGLGAWFPQYNSAASPTIVLHPHNGYLQLYADTGLAGAIALATGIGVFGLLAWRLWHGGPGNTWTAAGKATAAAIVALAVSSLFEVNTALSVVGRDSAGVTVSYHPVGVPTVWALAAMLIIACYHASLPLPRWLAVNGKGHLAGQDSDRKSPAPSTQGQAATEPGENAGEGKQ